METSQEQADRGCGVLLPRQPSVLSVTRRGVRGSAAQPLLPAHPGPYSPYLPSEKQLCSMENAQMCGVSRPRIPLLHNQGIPGRPGWWGPWRADGEE